MGLDTFACTKSPHKPLPDDLFKDVPNILVGGMLSGNGSCSSFRGKQYASFILRYCDVSLYQEVMSDADLDKILVCLGALTTCLKGAQKGQHLKLLKHNSPFENPISAEEVEALFKWFKVVKDNDGVVSGWW